MPWSQAPWPRLLISSWARKKSAERTLKPAKNIYRQSSLPLPSCIFFVFIFLLIHRVVPFVSLVLLFKGHLPSHQSSLPLLSHFFFVFLSLLHHHVVYFSLSSSSSTFMNNISHPISLGYHYRLTFSSYFFLFFTIALFTFPSRSSL